MTSGLIPISLCLFAVVCYGVYLIMNLESGLIFVSEYSSYISQLETLDSLYLFGKMGIGVYAIVEGIILIGYLKSGVLSSQEFLLFIIVVIITDLIGYVIVSYLYENVKSTYW